MPNATVIAHSATQKVVRVFAQSKQPSQPRSITESFYLERPGSEGECRARQGR